MAKHPNFSAIRGWALPWMKDFAPQAGKALSPKQLNYDKGNGRPATFQH